MQNNRYSCRIFMKIEFSQQIFEKKMKYQIASKSVQQESSYCMQKNRWTEVRTDMTKLVFAFRNFSNAF
jgi:hypothetical protein